MALHSVPDPEHVCEHSSDVLIEPPAVRLIHNTRGILAEVFHPEGVEINIDAYDCPNPECNCGSAYYLEIAVKIPKAEYDRIRSEPGWEDAEDDESEEDDDDCRC